MYQNAALLAALVFAYSVMAGGIARSWLSGPILFAGAGFALGPLGLNALRLELTGADLKLIAEASLAMALFTDAASTNIGVVRRSLALPGRLLLIGLPLTIALGFLAATALFPTARSSHRGHACRGAGADGRCARGAGYSRRDGADRSARSLEYRKRVE